MGEVQETTTLHTMGEVQETTTLHTMGEVQEKTTLHTMGEVQEKTTLHTMGEVQETATLHTMGEVQETTTLHTMGEVQETTTLHTMGEVQETATLHTMGEVQETATLHTMGEVQETTTLHTMGEVQETTTLHTMGEVQETAPLHTMGEVQETTTLHTMGEVQETTTLHTIGEVQETTTLHTMGDTNINPSQHEEWTVDNNHHTEQVTHIGQNVSDNDNVHGKSLNVLSGDESHERTHSDTLNEPHLSDLTTETENKLTVCDEVNDNIEHSVNHSNTSNDTTDIPTERTACMDEDERDGKYKMCENNKQESDTSCSSSNIPGDNMEDYSELASHTMDRTGHETHVDQSRTQSGGQTNVSDAHLTYVDENDGLLKFLGRACGGNKKKILDEELEPYANNPFNMGKASTAYGASPMNEDAGARLARSGLELVSHPESNPENVLDDKAMPWNNETVNTYGASNDNEADRRRLYYKKAEARTTVSPIRHPEDASNNASTNVFHATERGRQPEGASNNASTNVSHAAARGHDITHRQSADDDCYDFSHSQRGFMVLVVNDTFTRQSYRDGAIWDLRNMKEIGRKFGFRSLQYQMKELNLTKPELMRVLLQAQRTDHSDCDCFLLMISTHGLEQRNALAGGKTDHAIVCADDQLIFTSSIVEMFNDAKCPSLKGKPKLFLIQACRGKQLDHGHDLPVAYPKHEDKTCSTTHTGNPRRRDESGDVSDTNWGNDSMRMNPYSQTAPTAQTSSTRPPRPRFYVPNVSQEHGRQGFHDLHGSRPVNWTSSRNAQKIYAPTPYAIVDTPSLKCDNDMLVMYAIPPGMFAWRNNSTGSWMIDYLHKGLMNHDLRHPKSFLKLLTRVNWNMSRRATSTPHDPGSHGKTAVSVIEHKLCKDILFDQKVPLRQIGGDRKML